MGRWVFSSAAPIFQMSKKQEIPAPEEWSALFGRIPQMTKPDSQWLSREWARPIAGLGLSDAEISAFMRGLDVKKLSKEYLSTVIP